MKEKNKKVAAKIFRAIVDDFCNRLENDRITIISTLQWKKITTDKWHGTAKIQTDEKRAVLFLLTKEQKGWRLTSLEREISPYGKVSYFATKKAAKKAAIALLVRFAIAQE